MMCSVKVCPRCGEKLFQDMGVCYGCLYDFRGRELRTSRNINSVPFVEEETSSRTVTIASDAYRLEDEIGDEWDKGLPPVDYEEVLGCV